MPGGVWAPQGVSLTRSLLRRDDANRAREDQAEAVATQLLRGVREDAQEDREEDNRRRAATGGGDAARHDAVSGRRSR